MTIETHETLHDIFPDDAPVLHALKVGNPHFRPLAGRFDELGKEIYRIEVEIEPASDERLEALKKERLAILDEIAALVAEHRTGAA